MQAVTARMRWITAYVAAVVVLIACTAVYLVQDRRHTRSPGRPAAAAATHAPDVFDAAFPVALSLHGAPDHSVPQGGVLTLGGQATSPRSIHRIELWDGARLFATQPEYGRTAQPSFRWPAVLAGPHVLYLRAYDAAGRVGTSQVVQLDVTTRLGGSSHTLITEPRGTTAGGLAAGLGVPIRDVRVSTAGAGNLALITVARPSSTSTDARSVTVQTGGPMHGGTAPTLVVQPSRCGVTVSARGVSGPVVVGSSVAGGGFVVAGHRIGPGTVTLDAMAPGTHVLLARAADGESAPVAFTVPQRCVTAIGWHGDTSIVGGILTTPTPVARGYAYVSVDGTSWQRVPADPTAFAGSGTRRIDLAGQLPSLSGRTMQVQAWSQDGLTARKIGSGSFTAVDPNLDVAAMIGSFDALTVAAETGTGGPGGLTQVRTLTQDGVVRLDWSTSSPQINRVKWQALVYSLPTTDTYPEPFGLLASGYSYPGIHIGTGPGSGGQFTIDTAAIKGRTAGSAGAPDSDLAAFQKYLTTSGGAIYVRVIGEGDSSAASGAPPIEVPIGTPSQDVSIVVPATGAENLSVHLDSVSVYPGQAPNEKYADCVHVSGTHWSDVTIGPKDYSLSFLKRVYPADGRYCFPPPSTGYCDSWLCEAEQGASELLSGLGDLWDIIATVYNGIIDAVVDFSTAINPVCIALGDGSSGDTCRALTKVVARAAIDAVLIAYGIPPSLPTTAQLVAIANGDLSELGEQILEEFGVPCDDLSLDDSESAGVKQTAAGLGVDVPEASDGTIDVCKLAIEALIKQVKGAVEQTTSDTVASDDYAISCPVQYCRLTSEPTGRVQPTVVIVHATRTAGPAVPGQMLPVHVGLAGNLYGQGLAPFQGSDGDLITSTSSSVFGVFTLSQLTPSVGPYTVPAGLAVTASVTRTSGSENLAGGPVYGTGTYSPQSP